MRTWPRLLPRAEGEDVSLQDVFSDFHRPYQCFNEYEILIATRR